MAPGAREYAHPLRDVANAESIRNDVLKNWQAANTPGLSAQKRERVLHIIVVGGGPSGTEFAGEVASFINTDLTRIDPGRAKDMRVTLIEASQLLGSFDKSLREYAVKKLVSEGVHLIKGAVKALRPQEIELSDGQHTGLRPSSDLWPSCRMAAGRIAVDEFMRVLVTEEGSADGSQASPGPQHPVEAVKSTKEQLSADEGTLTVVSGVFALGDCCSPRGKALPALAQVAEQQGKYLARCLNDTARGSQNPLSTPFVYRSLSSMASLGGTSGIMELGMPTRGPFTLAGFASWFAWRSAYLTKLQTARNRLSLVMDWTSAMLFGRDVGRW